MCCVFCLKVPTIQANHKERECGSQTNLSIIANSRVAYPFHLLNKNAPAVASIYYGKSFDWLFVQIQRMEFNFNLLPFRNKKMCFSLFFLISNVYCVLGHQIALWVEKPVEQTHKSWFINSVFFIRIALNCSMLSLIPSLEF